MLRRHFENSAATLLHRYATKDGLRDALQPQKEGDPFDHLFWNHCKRPCQVTPKANSRYWRAKEEIR